MSYDLKDQIAHLVDTEAPPIDVSALARQLAQTGSDASDMPVTTMHPEVRTRWRRNRAFAFACAFIGVIVVFGAALAAGVLMNQPGGGDVAGSVAPEVSASSGVEAWWIVLAVVTIGVGALVAWRRRPTAGEEPVMQTIERTEQPTTDPQVEHLTGQRRWLSIALAVVVVLAAVAIGWLIAENRSLSDDLAAATEELAGDAPTMAEQAKIDLMDNYFAALTAGDVAGIASFHETSTSIVYDGVTYDLAGWQAFLEPYASSGNWEWGVFNTTVLDTGQVVTTFLMANPSGYEFYPHVAILKMGPNGRIAHVDTFEI